MELLVRTKKEIGPNTGRPEVSQFWQAFYDAHVTIIAKRGKHQGLPDMQFHQYSEGFDHPCLSLDNDENHDMQQSTTKRRRIFS
jgi:hypothetical protein